MFFTRVLKVEQLNRNISVCQEKEENLNHAAYYSLFTVYDDIFYMFLSIS